MHATRDQFPVIFGSDAAGIRGVDWGELRATFVSIPAGSDITPLLEGLPNNRCPCPHWGYVLKGQMLVTHDGGEESIRAGEIFYIPPGHTMFVDEDVEYVEFSPPAVHDAFMEAARRNWPATATA